MDILEASVKLAYPFAVPRFCTALFIFKETENANIGTAHKIRLSIQQHLPRGRIGLERAHGKTGLVRVGAGIHRQFIKEWIFRRPEVRVRDLNYGVQSGFFASFDLTALDFFPGNYFPGFQLAHHSANYRFRNLATAVCQLNNNAGPLCSPDPAPPER